MQETLSPRQKALSINLDPSIYGTFAEIGAGQEVVRHFFTAGGASATVAKSMSAYDMLISDMLYGKEESGRYVCKSRLFKMLDREYELLTERLSKARPKSRFFVFANTVVTRQYKKDNESHGWLGVKFQHTNKSTPSSLIMHVRLLDNQSFLQQRVLGVMGVNMLHACYFRNENVSMLMDALMDELDRKQIEIDFIQCQGKAFNHIDNRLLNLQLVQKGLTDAVMFSKDKTIELASERLYKKPVLIVRGSFRPPTKVNLDMLQCGLKQFLKDSKLKKSEVTVLSEITLNRATGKDREDIDHEDFLARVELLQELGENVLISNYHEYFRLSSYFARFTQRPVGLVLGVYNYRQIFDEAYYSDLPGGVLESMGLLFRPQMKIYVYPYQEEKGGVTTSKNLKVPKNFSSLLSYLKDNNSVSDLVGFNSQYLKIYSRKVLTMIQKGVKGWEHMVPELVAKKIKKEKLFGYSGS